MALLCPFQSLTFISQRCLLPSFWFSQNKEAAEWKENQLSSDADAITLQDLSFSSDYQLEVKAINANGSSIPATFNFTIGAQPCM